jgi:hypothetical protein
MIMVSRARHYGYDTPEWRKMIKEFIAQNPSCIGCAAIGKRTPATIMDHIIPHKGDRSKFFSGPFQPLCSWCHGATKRMLERAFEVGEVKAEDLHMASAAAVKLSRRRPRPSTIGAEGWPSDD